LIFEYFWKKKTVEKKLPKFHKNRTRIKGTLHNYQYTFLIISLSILVRMSNISTKFVDEIKIYIFFLDNPAFYEINVEKYCRVGQATDDIMKHALCILDNKRMHTYSQYAMLYCFSTATMAA